MDISLFNLCFFKKYFKKIIVNESNKQAKTEMWKKRMKKDVA